MFARSRDLLDLTRTARNDGDLRADRRGVREALALAVQADLREVACLADLVAIDSSAPALCALAPEQLLDGLVFASKDNVITDLWSAGRHSVRNGRHVAREQIIKNYRTAVAKLLETA